MRLNKPKLGFVLCRGFADGEPYAEGYFMEYDHELTPEERFRFDPSETMPPFDPETAPKLDPEVWPPDRIAKSKRNFGRGYVEESILSLLEILDPRHRSLGSSASPTRASPSSTAGSSCRKWASKAPTPGLWQRS